MNIYNKFNKIVLEKEKNRKCDYLVARAYTWPVEWLRMSQSRRIPFFPDAPTHVSISITSPLQNDKSMLNPEGATI